MASPIGFLYLVKKALEAGPSKASQEYEAAMRYGNARDRLRERTRRLVRELFAFWILGSALIAFVLIPMVENVRETRGLLEFLLLVWACGGFLAGWALYRLVRFALAR